ncbi:hypothetical protein GCM10020001_075630 [Nonomuraea salmonea]
MTGLKNGQSYTWTLRARNEAGESQERAEATAELRPPSAQFKNANNNDTNTLIRSAPGGGEAGKIPKGEYITLTVLCQQKGPAYTDQYTGQSSDVWNKIESPRGNGWLNDVLVDTPKGASRPPRSGSANDHSRGVGAGRGVRAGLCGRGAARLLPGGGAGRGRAGRRRRRRAVDAQRRPAGGAARGDAGQGGAR